MSGPESAAHTLAALRRVLDLPLRWPSRQMILLFLADRADERGQGTMHLSELSRRTGLGVYELTADINWLSGRGYLVYDLEPGHYQLDLGLETAAAEPQS